MTVTGEIEIAYRYCSSPIIAVTGTNGKSTVVNVTGKILETAGMKTVVAGNIGTPFASVVEKREPYDVIVLDAFGSTSIPFHLVTQEAFGLIASRLTPGGLLAINVESDGWHGDVVRAVSATLRTRFTHVVALHRVAGGLLRPVAEAPSLFPEPVRVEAEPQTAAVLIRVRDASDEDGSLKPRWPSVPIPKI
mgnify:CR=1 FL=1